MSQTTKWAMAMALKCIMTQKPLSKITIADITEACGINRMTFYYHFQDIYDLFPALSENLRPLLRTVVFGKPVHIPLDDFGSGV